MSNFQILLDESGEIYHQYGLSYSQYKKTNQKLIELSSINGSQIVIDLACGTGLTTKEILKKNPEKIYAVDFSKDMLNQAKRFIGDNEVNFILSDASKIDQVISEKVDRVLCNSAFWQFPDQIQVLKSIKNTLKEDGLFIFNLNSQFYDFGLEESHRTRIIKEIFSEMEKRGYNPQGKLKEKVNQKLIQKMIDESGLVLIKTELYSFEGARLEDTIDFFKIPAVAPFFDGVPSSEQEEILSLVKSRLEKEELETPLNKWIYFVVGNK